MTLDDLWAEVFLSYKAVALPHMPNFFMLNGPFSPGGSMSIMEIIENHTLFVGQLIRRALDEDVLIAPSRKSTEAHIAEIRERAQKTVWFTGGCNSWYLDAKGVPLVNPVTVAQLQDMMRAPDYDDFVVRKLEEA